jgi:RNA polymerase sigma-70 factor (ECF subfamily)
MLLLAVSRALYVRQRLPRPGCVFLRIPQRRVQEEAPRNECNPREPAIVSPSDAGTQVSAQEDEAAVDRVLRGDASAFAPIVERWQGPLINLAYRYCRDRGRAEDMAQEAFLRAFRHLGTWRRESAFSTWLFALATNVYRTEIRRIPPRAVSLDEIVPRAAPDQADADMLEGDRRRAVRNAVRSLPAKYRDVLLLYYFHDQDVAAAAGSLRVPEGTVKARLSRGRDLVRRKLKGVL